MVELPNHLNALLFYEEAIASVSLSHPAKCDCVICRAAAGDHKALAEIIERVQSA